MQIYGKSLIIWSNSRVKKDHTDLILNIKDKTVNSNFNKTSIIFEDVLNENKQPTRLIWVCSHNDGTVSSAYRRVDRIIPTCKESSVR